MNGLVFQLAQVCFQYEGVEFIISQMQPNIVTQTTYVVKVFFTKLVVP